MVARRAHPSQRGTLLAAAHNMSRPRRLSSFNYIGRAVYFLTLCAAERRAAFVDAVTVALVLLQFREAAAEESFAILAYCLMPDHAHLLMEGRDATSDLQRFVKMAKQRSGWAYRQRFGMPLWREGYFERTLRPHEDPRAVARYVINNPIRAGLAATPADYPHLGSDVWSLTDLIQSLI